MTTEMQNKKGMGARVPALRFPEFSGQWEEKRLGNFLVKHEEKTTKNKQYPVITSSQRGIFLQKEYFAGKDVASDDTTGYNVVPRGYFTYRHMSDTLVFKFNINTLVDRGIVSTLYPVFTTKDIADSFLLTKLNEGKEFKRYAVLQKQGGSRTYMYYSKLKDLKLNLPAFPEQQKIAEFFGVVDEKIEGLAKKKKSLEAYKKGVMQKIFSQEVRFKDENGNSYPNWEEKRLGKIGETYNGLSGKSGEDFGKGEPFITYKQIFDNSTVDVQKFSLVRVENSEKQNRAKFGDVFFTTSSETPHEVGFASVLLDRDSSPYLNSFSFGFRPNSFDQLDPYFAKFFFRSSLFRRDVVRLAQGSTRYNISKVAFMKITAMFPRKEEQKKIAEFLTSLDEKIFAIGNELNCAKDFKKGLLQQMFV